MMVQCFLWSTKPITFEKHTKYLVNQRLYSITKAFRVSIYITPPDDKQDEPPSIWVSGSDWDSIFSMISPDQTCVTLKISAPSDEVVIPKQKDFPTKSRIGCGNISGSSIFKFFYISDKLKI